MLSVTTIGQTGLRGAPTPSFGGAVAARARFVGRQGGAPHKAGRALGTVLVAPARPAPPQAPQALPGWPFWHQSGGDHGGGGDDPSPSAPLIPTSTADLLACTVAGIEGMGGGLALLTLRLEDCVPAPGLPRTLRMTVSSAQADLIAAAAGWGGWGGDGGRGGVPPPPAPPAAAPVATGAQPSALDTAEACVSALGGSVAAAVVWRFDGIAFGAGLCLTPRGGRKGVVGGSAGANPPPSVPVPARPSDAMILALRAGAPLYVTREVWVTAASPEAWAEEKEEEEEDGEGGPGAWGGSSRGAPAPPSPAAAASPSSSSSTFPPALARILDALAAADALLAGRHHRSSSSPSPPWAQSGHRLGAAPHAGLPSAAALAEAGHMRAEAAAALAALASRPLAAVRGRASLSLLKMQVAAAEQRFGDAAAAREALDAHVAGDPAWSAACALEAALEDGRLEDGVRHLGALLERGWESEGEEE